MEVDVFLYFGYDGMNYNNCESFVLCEDANYNFLQPPFKSTGVECFMLKRQTLCAVYHFKVRVLVFKG